MPADTQISPEVAALKSGLGVFYGRLLGALERIAAALESDAAAGRVLTRGK
jgi:hypothetical protein